MKAAQFYEKASSLNPDDYQAVSLLVGVNHGLGREAAAEATQLRAIQLTERHLERHPEDARALYLGAGILARMGQTEKGYEWARRALAIEPNELQFFVTLRAFMPY